MTRLNEDHPDVGDEVFYFPEFGIAWKLRPRCTLFFSGLRVHAGSQPMYTSSERVDSTDYQRDTMVAYPQSRVLNGTSAIPIGPLNWNMFLPLPPEMRNTNPSVSRGFFVRLLTFCPKYGTSGQSTLLLSGNLGNRWDLSVPTCFPSGLDVSHDGGIVCWNPTPRSS